MIQFQDLSPFGGGAPSWVTAAYRGWRWELRQGPPGGSVRPHVVGPDGRAVNLDAAAPTLDEARAILAEYVLTTCAGPAPALLADFVAVGLWLEGLTRYAAAVLYRPALWVVASLDAGPYPNAMCRRVRRPVRALSLVQDLAAAARDPEGAALAREALERPRPALWLLRDLLDDRRAPGAAALADLISWVEAKR